MVEGVFPRSNGPDARKMASAPTRIEPGAGTLVSEFLPGCGIVPRNSIIDLLLESQIRRLNRNPVGRIAELEIIHGSGADGFAQLGGGNSTWLDPGLVNHAEWVASPAKSGRGSPESPGVVSELQHQSEALGQIDIASGIFFPP